MPKPNPNSAIDAALVRIAKLEQCHAASQNDVLTLSFTVDQLGNLVSSLLREVHDLKSKKLKKS